MHSLEALVRSDSVYYNYSPGKIARTYLLYPICVGEFMYEAGYDLQRSTFDSFLLEVILDGTVQIETDGEELCAQAGSVVLIDCHKPHRYYSQTGWHALWVHFDGMPARGYFDMISRLNGHVFFTQRQNDVQTALRALLQGFQHKAILPETQMAKLLTDALTAMAEPRGGSSETEHAAEKAIASINHALGHEPSVAQLAKNANLSEYHFIRIFREFVGMTPRQYIIAARMAHARYLLKTTKLAVSEIAALVGYASESMFSATFKRAQGMTPTAYRAEGRTE